jgi:aspartyl-tRNA(Asn)/glutamyl-tRNA(Gln) amidotransferase subunit A
VTPEQRWAEARQRIAAEDGRIGAFLELAPEPDWSTLPDGPLRGTPMAVKANLEVAGMAHSAGIAARRDRRAEADATAVARLRAAGAVVVGTTNLAEGALGSVTDNPYFGPTRNPLDPTRHAGGSSGGSAAAVAAGMVPAALGTDTMGSIRIPAAWCGLVGLKPSAGVVPTEGLVPLSDLLDTIGPIGRRVDDVACLLVALTHRRVPDPPSVNTLRLVAVDPGVELAPPVEAAWQEAVDRLRTAGADLTEVPLGVDLRRIRLSGLLDVQAGAAAYHAADLDRHPEGFSPRFRELVGYAHRKTAVDLAAAQRRLRAVAGWLTAVADHADALVLPTVAHPPPLLEEGEQADTADTTAFVNAAGAPAITLPLSHPEGLPASLQLVGTPGEDHRLVAVAAALEAVLEGQR